jgi:hypothetical protein
VPDPNIIKIEEDKIGFMFVCKAGNTSIKEVLKTHFCKDRIIKNIHTKTALLPYVKYCKKDTFTDDYLVFGTCRHPEDRLISCWKDKIFNRFHPGFRHKEYNFYRKMPFSDFVEEILNIEDGTDCEQHIRSQHFDLDVERIDYLIRMESFYDDWEKSLLLIKNHCGKNYPKMTFHKNKTESVDLEISKETRALVEKRYARDYELLGYKKRS